MHHLRAKALMLGLCLSLTGCGLRHPEQVESLAAEAAQDPRKIGKLVTALRSKHDEVRATAQDELVALGPAAVPELRDVILRKRPEAGPALLVLGKMGDPIHFALIEQHLGDPTLGPWADDGLKAGAKALWDRIAEDPELALCDAYLDWFPSGAHQPAVRDLRRQLEAEGALIALGQDPRYGALVSYHRRYGDTAAGERARLMLAERALTDAQDEITKGRPRQALRYVEEAREWNPEAPADPVEAAARESWATSLAAEESWDGAIEQLALAASLGGGNPALLGDHYMKRAAARLQADDPVGGMTDLLRAAATFAPLGMPAQAERTRQGRRVLKALRGDTLATAIGIEALAMAGPELQDEVEALVWERLVAGDPEPLEVLVQAASAPRVGEPAGVWLDLLVARAVTDTSTQVDALLADSERLRALLEPGTLWSADGELEREDAVALLRAHEGAVRAAIAHVASGRTSGATLPGAAPEDPAALQSRAKAGAEPLDPALDPLVRAQLARFALEHVDVLRELAWRQPGLLASQFVGLEILPVSLTEWAVFAAETQEARRYAVYRVTLRDAKEAELIIRVQDGVMRVELSLFGPSVPLSDGAMVDALTVLFGTARPLLFVHNDVSRVDVVMGMTLASGSLDQRLRLGLDQRTAQRMNWSLVEAEAPYTTDHLGLVLDQEIR